MTGRPRGGDVLRVFHSHLHHYRRLEGSKIEQFSHFSVKEFLTSDRHGLQTTDVENVRQYSNTFRWNQAAHTLLAQACLTILLELDENVDRKRLETFVLAFYVAAFFFNENVTTTLFLFQIAKLMALMGT